jgi:hypothetical protein
MVKNKLTPAESLGRFNRFEFLSVAGAHLPWFG